jgi:hypothetical protein
LLASLTDLFFELAGGLRGNNIRLPNHDLPEQPVTTEGRQAPLDALRRLFATARKNSGE